MNSSARQQAQEQFMALIAQGARRFPKPIEPPASSNSTASPNNIKQQSQPDVNPGPTLAAEPAVPGHTQRGIIESIQCCEACPLACPKKAVAAVIEPCPIAIIADFPTTAELNSPIFFSDSSSPHQILHRLCERIKIKCHRSFAVKCPPIRGMSSQATKTCANHLRAELQQVRPKLVLCFGSRALEGVAFAYNLKQPIADFEAVKVESGEATVLALPSSLELEHYKEWRARVWEVIQSSMKGI